MPPWFLRPPPDLHRYAHEDRSSLAINPGQLEFLELIQEAAVNSPGSQLLLLPSFLNLDVSLFGINIYIYIYIYIRLTNDVNRENQNENKHVLHTIF